MFSSGRIWFAVLFVLVFVTGLVWAYRRDLAVHRTHYRKAYRVLFGILLAIALLVLLVRIRRFF
jgi:hypothetical protein